MEVEVEVKLEVISLFRLLSFHDTIIFIFLLTKESVKRIKQSGICFAFVKVKSDLVFLIPINEVVMIFI